MGSHGGATAEGQRYMLESLGMTEEAMGAEIRSTMETVEVARTPGGMPIYLDKHAAGGMHDGEARRPSSSQGHCQAEYEAEVLTQSLFSRLQLTTEIQFAREIFGYTQLQLQQSYRIQASG